MTQQEETQKLVEIACPKTMLPYYLKKMLAERGTIQSFQFIDYPENMDGRGILYVIINSTPTT